MKTLFKIAVAITFVAIIGACKTPLGNTAQQSNATQHTGSIIEKYWKLIEINGKPVIMDESTGGRGAFIILKDEGNRLTGSGGCNTLTGVYEIDQAANRIRFSQIATTLMACLNMEIEEELKRILEMVDNYSLSEDGKYLSLNRARMAPLARFEVVYLR